MAANQSIDQPKLSVTAADVATDGPGERVRWILNADEGKPKRREVRRSTLDYIFTNIEK